jgi:hypothetical protein
LARALARQRDHAAVPVSRLIALMGPALNREGRSAATPDIGPEERRSGEGPCLQQRL